MLPALLVHAMLPAAAGNCLRSCTSGSAQWRLRPPAADLWGDHQASWTEVHLMNVLLGSVLLHRSVLRCCGMHNPCQTSVMCWWAFA
jgi:hypothetical protein